MVTMTGWVAALLAMPAAAATYDLPATPATVAWGHYDATSKPVLSIRSGDTVVVHTLLTNSPTGLEKAGVAPTDVEPSLRAVFDCVPQADRGPGGHILTGPIAIEGAEPGDTLEIRILKIDLAIPYAYNAFRYGAGFLTDDFPYPKVKIVPLDRKRMIGQFAPGIDVPLHPFFPIFGLTVTALSILADWLDPEAGRPSTILLIGLFLGGLAYYHFRLRQVSKGWGFASPDSEIEAVKADA